ncbi:MAG TPA: endolytic transglycosylase MltG [Acidobacteriota bacterium]|nr:endolytic transglycosylase MltG [Acidobacteriota bacterium]
MAGRRSRIVVLLFLLILTVALAAAYLIYQECVTSYRGYTEEQKLITIETGSSLSSVANKMQTEGIVQHAWLLKGIFYYYHTAGKIKAGTYEFDRPLSPLEVHRKLIHGEFNYRSVTIIPGADFFDVQRNLVDSKIGNSMQVREALGSPKTLQALAEIDPKIDSVEGFLYPETYFVSDWAGPQQAVLMMIHQFGKKFGAAEKQQAKQLGMTTVQVITLASLIEKEAANEEERPLISGVFHNRLAKKMLLQCDPTVIYAMKLAGVYNGQLLSDDLKRPSPYNTYMNAGLPPGPICNPGAASIHAALFPIETDKLYFVLKPDGTHQFSATLAEHNRAVAIYRHSR